MLHVDTSFLIRALEPGSPEDHALRGWIEGREPLAMSAVAWAELLCGPLDPAELKLAEAIVGPPRDFTRDHAAVAARLFNHTGRRRGSVIDCMIAAAALADGAAIATANTADFRRFQEAGLTLKAVGA